MNKNMTKTTGEIFLLNKQACSDLPNVRFKCPVQYHRFHACILTTDWPAESTIPAIRQHKKLFEHFLYLTCGSFVSVRFKIGLEWFVSKNVDHLCPKKKLHVTEVITPNTYVCIIRRPLSSNDVHDIKTSTFDAKCLSRTEWVPSKLNATLSTTEQSEEFLHLRSSAMTRDVMTTLSYYSTQTEMVGSVAEIATRVIQDLLGKLCWAEPWMRWNILRKTVWIFLSCFSRTQNR